MRYIPFQIDVFDAARNAELAREREFRAMHRRPDARRFPRSRRGPLGSRFCLDCRGSRAGRPAIGQRAEFRAPGASASAVAQVLEQVELRHDARRLLPARPRRRAGAPPHSRANASSSVADASTSGSGDVHHLADGPVDDRRVADRPGRGAPFSMIDPTSPATASPSASSETGIWLIPYSWSSRDRLADPLGRPGDDDRRPLRAVVAAARGARRCGRPRRSWRAGRSPASTRRCRASTCSSCRRRAGSRRRPPRAARAGSSAMSTPRLVERRQHRGAGRLAGEDPLLAGHPAGHRERVPVGDPDPAVDDGRVVRAREEVLADPLLEVRPGRVAATARCPRGRRR